MTIPSVTIAIPVLNEEAHIRECLRAVTAQEYAGKIEVLVIDGGSTDRSDEFVSEWPDVRLLRNSARIQAAALNIALREAQGDIFVRVDAHTVVAEDYVDKCVQALLQTGAAIVGGAMTPVASRPVGRGIAAAMASPFGAGTARFHTGGFSGWVDTVYMGAFHTNTAIEVGGYREVAVNEDAEFAIRMRERGGIWLDRSIRSLYRSRTDFLSLQRQFQRYGRGRAATVRTHPGSMAPRQLAPLAFAAGLLTPWRRLILIPYLCCLSWTAIRHKRRDPVAATAMVLAIPIMHLSWAAGFVQGLLDLALRDFHNGSRQVRARKPDVARYGARGRIPARHNSP